MSFCRDDRTKHNKFVHGEIVQWHPIQQVFHHHQAEYKSQCRQPIPGSVPLFTCCGKRVGEMRRSRLGSWQTKLPSWDHRHVSRQAGCLIYVSIGRNDCCHEAESPFHAISKISRILCISSASLPEYIAKQVPFQPDSYSKQEPNVRTLRPGTRMMVHHMQLKPILQFQSQLSLSASPDRLKIEKLEDDLRFFGELSTKLQEIFPERDAKDFSLSLHLTHVHKSLSILDRRNGVEKPVFNPSASSPFRRQASRGLPFRGFPVWWAMQFAIYLARCLTQRDSVPRFKEGSRHQCSRPCVFLFRSAAWPVKIHRDADATTR